MDARDLAPGDRDATRLDFSKFKVDEIRSANDPLFEVVYETFLREFNRGDSLESREVLARRLAWPESLGLRYSMCLVRDPGGNIAAVRDHSNIRSSTSCTVHLSHLLVLPAWRRTGLAGWMRALPLKTVRAPATLVAEMDSNVAMAAYSRAGFRRVDPARASYFQPDFRTPAEIKAAGGPRPVPFTLVIRRVGAEQETQITPRALRNLVGDLYRMYGQTCRPQELPSLDAYPPDDAEPIDLLP